MSNIKTQLKYLKLAWMRENYEHELAEAARTNRTNQDMFERLISGEHEARTDRCVQRCIKQAQFPAIRTPESFDYTWPASINADQVRHLFTLNFMASATNVVFIGGVGLGKSHLAAAIGREACMHKHKVLFTPAVTIINTLAEAQNQGSFTRIMRRYTKPDLLIIDELGYLPVDRVGAEFIFQVLGARYEKASTIITTNRPYKDWGKTFDNDATLTSAVLDRVLHHCETVIITGTSFRMKEKLDR